MMSKKDMLTLGVLAVGGIALASQIQDKETTLLGRGGFMPMGGVITPTQGALPTGDLIYNTPTQHTVSFSLPAIYAYTIMFLAAIATPYFKT